MGVLIQTKDTPSSCSLQHGPSGCFACVSTCLSPWVKAGSLMCIDYCGQIDLPCINLFLDYRSYSARARQTICPMTSVEWNILWRIRWIDYNGIVRFVVFDEISIIVAGSSP